jgi:hypothetical protein
LSKASIRKNRQQKKEIEEANLVGQRLDREHKNKTTVNVCRQIREYISILKQHNSLKRNIQRTPSFRN